jgi:hypothetical protein
VDLTASCPRHKAEIVGAREDGVVEASLKRGLVNLDTGRCHI